MYVHYFKRLEECYGSSIALKEFIYHFRPPPPCGLVIIITDTDPYS